MVWILHNIALLSLVTFVLSACDFSNNFCEISGLSCPSTSSTLLTNGSNTYSSSNVDVLSFNNLFLDNSDIRGRVATRNNLQGSSNGFVIGDSISNSNSGNSNNGNQQYSLIVGQSLLLDGSARIFPNDSNSINFVGSGFTSQNNGNTGLSNIRSCATNGLGNNCLNPSFDSSQSYWNQYSKLLASQRDNVRVTYLNSRATIFCINNGSSGNNDNRFYYVTLNPSNLTNGFGFSGCSASGSLVINWVGNDNFTFVGTQASLNDNINNNNNNRGYMIYNFPTASMVMINSTSFYGDVVAPSSNVFIYGGNITGSIVAGDLTIGNARVNQLTSCRTSSSTNEESSAAHSIVNLVLILASAAVAISI